ncbi:hypothetical protein HW511_00320 [Asaia siamensis]|nr:hypothetical protein [Asaia siamensis]
MNRRSYEIDEDLMDRHISAEGECNTPVERQINHFFDNDAGAISPIGFHRYRITSLKDATLAEIQGIAHPTTDGELATTTEHDTIV